VVSSYPSAGIKVQGDITTGPDGAVWFTSITDNAIGRITTAGVATRFKMNAGTFPDGITAGPDGALWSPRPTTRSSACSRDRPSGVARRLPATVPFLGEGSPPGRRRAIWLLFPALPADFSTWPFSSGAIGSRP
jgi:hypothetical protein